MYLSNLRYWGHQVNCDNYETTHLHNDFYEIFNNPHVSILALLTKYIETNNSYPSISTYNDLFNNQYVSTPFYFLKVEHAQQ